MRCYSCGLDPCACAANPVNHGVKCACEGCRRLERIHDLLYEPIPLSCPRCGGRERVALPPKGEPPWQQEFQNEIPCPACQYCVCGHHLGAHILRASGERGRCDFGVKDEDCFCELFVATGSMQAEYERANREIMRGLGVPESYLVVESTLSRRDSLFRKYVDRGRRGMEQAASEVAGVPVKFKPTYPKEIEP